MGWGRGWPGAGLGPGYCWLGLAGPDLGLAWPWRGPWLGLCLGMGEALPCCWSRCILRGLALCHCILLAHPVPSEHRTKQNTLTEHRTEQNNDRTPNRPEQSTRTRSENEHEHNTEHEHAFSEHRTAFSRSPGFPKENQRFSRRRCHFAETLSIFSSRAPRSMVFLRRINDFNGKVFILPKHSSFSASELQKIWFF